MMLELEAASARMALPAGSDFVRPYTFRFFSPTTLLSVTTHRTAIHQRKEPSLPNKLLLALFLQGYQLAGTGSIASFDEPRWASFGTSHRASLLSERHPGQDTPLSDQQFHDAVDLAHKIPDFGGQEGSGKEIVLYRVLRGCGTHWQQSGFLDFAIALEAALLSGITSELSYRFSLYGALFLRDSRDPRRTFDQLHNIYSVRSKLVHGSRVNATHRQAAEADAAELALAVVRKSVESGWPDAEVLNHLAFEP